MADLKVRDGELVLALSGAEKLEGVHGDLHAPFAAVSGIEVLNDAHTPAGLSAGVRAGTRVPGVIEVGTIQRLKRRLFAAVHHDTPRGLRVRLEGLSYDEWIVGLRDPEGKLAELEAHLRAS